MKQRTPKILFSDNFEVKKSNLDDYGAFDISLISDIPLFIDPFLLFNSGKKDYQDLHRSIIKYLVFLRNKSTSIVITPGLLKAWYQFNEVNQNWLGFSGKDNNGRGLGNDFAKALNENFNRIFGDYGKEKITSSSHLEKLCLIKEGVGKDSISDFTTNLIKKYLLDYTQEFTLKFLGKDLCKKFMINKVKFNYKTESWENMLYFLPNFKGNFVLLTPKDILTKDDTWINRDDLFDRFEMIPMSIGDKSLRDQINNYLIKELPIHPTKEDEKKVYIKTVAKFPEIIDYYIKYKETNSDYASDISNEKVQLSEKLYIEQFTKLVELLAEKTKFYELGSSARDECMQRVLFIKQIIENEDGYKFFYLNGIPIKREEDLQIAYKFCWFGSIYDVNREVNNGRGPVDYKISKGTKNTCLVEFKLASNTHLKDNLAKQVEVYEKANGTDCSIKVVLYFSSTELKKIERYLKNLKLDNDKNIVLIDARRDNKVSASRLKISNRD